MRLKCVSGSRHFQPGEGPGRGLLRDCKTLDNLREPSFKALPARYWAITQHRGHGDLLCQAAAHRRGYQVPQEAHALR